MENDTKKNIIKNKISKKESNINIIRIENININQYNNPINDKSINKKTNNEYCTINNLNNNNRNKNKNKLNLDNLNDQELNNLEYEQALKIDKRTYLQYYWSLLKKKHLLLFTFYPINDYNLVSIKICLFLLSFSLYFTINGFFFNDDTMHKIYIDNGSFNIIYQIPTILYSSIISAVINMILKQLSLSENNILSIKKEENLKKLVEYSKRIKKCIIIKFSPNGYSMDKPKLTNVSLIKII